MWYRRLAASFIHLSVVLVLVLMRVLAGGAHQQRSDMTTIYSSRTRIICMYACACAWLWLRSVVLDIILHICVRCACERASFTPIRSRAKKFLPSGLSFSIAIHTEETRKSIFPSFSVCLVLYKLFNFLCVFRWLRYVFTIFPIFPIQKNGFCLSLDFCCCFWGTIFGVVHWLSVVCYDFVC